ncbi:5-carboxymethyl-2-hydroxymuconate Delta-isomerase [Bowmanella dokdonensis]|uniref:5-carboxymethyl-2-hydroxymuconate Delta-isomerase n=1 Tax=Bowmanella dokdonensis TaxID=751969 RepID=A0A939ILX6_9ALTE|nr:5-carboxymethyl-2-hydroxymuconate Delta-isomerase [Bowmanella dokdonensis]MBN7824683.1 5-carboxymethyl-2-hydroxymuconate Delta-isomerase [Bowmanella dokdonensis]
MPHCVVEYSKALETRVMPEAMMQSVFEGAVASGLFTPEAIKTRAIACDYYMVGDQVADFIHVQLRILSGRTDAQKAALAKAVLDRLTELKLSHLSITAEVLDMHKESYAKVLL